MSTIPKKVGAHHKLAAIYLVAGIRPGEVARRLGWHPSTLAHLQQMPAFRAELAALQQELRSQVIEATARQLVEKSQPAVVSEARPPRRG